MSEDRKLGITELEHALPQGGHGFGIFVLGATMKRFSAFILLVLALSLTCSVATQAQIYRGPNSAKEAQKAARKDQKRAAKRQRKANKQLLKAQHKAAKRARHHA
jgi:hypothetical protein